MKKDFTKNELRIIISAMNMTGGDFDNDQTPDQMKKLGQAKRYQVYESAYDKLLEKLNPTKP